MPIPKKIHYCWFGGAEKPPLVQNCIASWKTHLPEYEIIEWNESNFEISSHPFADFMHKNRKWAFLSDYVRMWAVYNYGGIYLDSDCEVKASLNKFLECDAFTGFERFFTSIKPFTACFGASPKHPWVDRCLNYYMNVDLNDSKAAFTTNTEIVSEIITNEFNAKVRDKKQSLKNGLILYPSYVLCTPNFWHKAFVIHHFNGSWTANHGKCPPLRVRIIELLIKGTPSRLHPIQFMAMKFWTKIKSNQHHNANKE